MQSSEFESTDTEPNVSLPDENGSKQIPANLSPRRFSILKLLKMRGKLTLSEIAIQMGVSKMAVLNHLSKLEEAGFVERDSNHKGELGRPEYTYRLTRESNEIFPKAYIDIAVCALSFIEQTQGREAVEKMLHGRQKELFDRYRGAIEERPSLKEKVTALTELRDSDGYMAESKSFANGSFEILERNCPILALAHRYGEACSTEKELFSLLLQSEVEVSHRVVAGDPVCRFLIRRRIQSC